MENLELAQHSGLHDFELIETKVDYNQDFVSMLFKSPANKYYEMHIKNFLLFEITHEEAWGKGKYVCSSEIKNGDSETTYLLEIELNSGDQIIVKYTL